MLSVVAPARDRARRAPRARNSGSLRPASSGVNSTSSQRRLRVAPPSRATRASTSRARHAQLVLHVELATSRGRCGCAAARAARTASHAGRCRARLARASAADDRRSAAPRGVGPTCSAIARTAARSSGDAAGNPASMTSTPRRASARATSSFSARRHRRARRLLAVAQRRVEDAYVRQARSSMAQSPGFMVTGSRNGIIVRSSRRPARCGCSRSLARCASNRLAGPSRSRRSTSGRTCPSWISPRSLLHRRRASRSSTTRGPADVVAVLGGVADRVAHVVEAAAVHEVDDELQLVQALEVGDLGLVAGLDQRLEARLDERAHAAAEHRLLAEEIGLGLLGERRLEHARARRADARGVRRARSACALPRRVLVHGEERGHAVARLDTSRARGGRGPWARSCSTSTSARRRDGAEADVEAVREHQRLARRAGAARSRSA